MLRSAPIDVQRNTQDASSRRTNLTRLLSSLLLRQETTIVAVIVAIGIFATLRNPTFATSDNLTEIARASVIFFVMGCGATLLMIGGGLDFSVGSVFTLGGVTGAWLLVHGVPWPIAVLAGIVAGVIVGFVNNTIIEYLHVPPIIATLGTFYLIFGFTIQVTGGTDILPLPESFQNLGQGSFAGVPYIVIYALAVGVIFWFLLENTPFGVNVRALGGNRQAAVANGLPVPKLNYTLYMVAGATAALGGLIYSARVGSGQVSSGGAPITLTVITAVLIGGVSLFGGLGTITGTLVGALLLAEIDNALILSSVPPQYNEMVIGSILIAAVAADHLRRKRLYRAPRRT